MKKYKINPWNTEIEEVEVERETNQCIFLYYKLGGRIHRESKKSDYSKYFDTKEEAIKYLTDRAEERVRNIKRNLEIEEDRLRRLRQLKGI